jgi:hypothetical protein
VIFSPCPTSFYLNGYHHFLGRDSGHGFGVRRWSVLANETAVHTDSTYLASLLKTVDRGQLQRLRMKVVSLRKYIRDFGVGLNESLDSGGLLSVVANIVIWSGKSSESA